MLALSVVLTWVNGYSVPLANSVQVVTTVAKVLALIVIIFGGFVKLFQRNTEILATGFQGSKVGFGRIFINN